MVSRSGEANSQPQAGTAIEQVGGELASAQHETAQAQDQVADLKASDDDRDGYDHPASSAARLLMGTRLFSALFVAFASLIQRDGNRLLLWLADLHLRFDV
jgi:hypothetical protein